MENERQLPKLADLYSDTDMKVAQNELNVLINSEPNPAWLQAHPFAKKQIIVEGKKVTVPAVFIPIERIEWLLTRIFLRWHVEIKSCLLIANSIVVTVRLYYQDVLSKEMLWQDGIGAVPLQTDQGAGAIEFDKIKSSAVQMAVPAAESYAFKDAAEKIGKFFGKDINRASYIDYTNLLGSVPDKKEKHDQMFEDEK